MAKRRIPPLGETDFGAAERRVLAHYEAFIAAAPAPGDPPDAKAFAAHHVACRAALVHLEALIRLSATVGGDGRKEDLRRVAAELNRARAALRDVGAEDEAPDAE
jgi:hypothetical protein